MSVLRAGPAAAQQGWLDDFIDDDGSLDASDWLLERKGFLPVPIIITEPAVGYGGGAALLFFRQSIEEVSSATKRGGHTPPDIYGVALAATENGTKAVGAGAMVTFDDDRWRYRGALGWVNLNLSFYGIGGALDSGVRSLGYSLDGLASSQQVLRRLGETDNFLALRWIFLDLSNTFDFGRPQIPDKSFAQRNSGLGVSWEYDSRDNIFTPSRGWTGAADAMFYGPAVGGDNTFQTYRAHVFAYWPIVPSVTLGGRLDGRTARGDVPFYMLPFIDMRGIPAARYQDQNVAVMEAEVRWNFTRRWSLIAFAGAGRAWGFQTGFGDAPNEVSKGVGFRYLIASKLGMHVGIDVARGPEDTAFYIQVGNAWR